MSDLNTAPQSEPGMAVQTEPILAGDRGSVGDAPLLAGGDGGGSAGNSEPTPKAQEQEKETPAKALEKEKASEPKAAPAPAAGATPGEGLLPLPDDATDDDRAAYDKKLRALNGVPEKADGYGDFGYGEAVDKGSDEYRHYTEAFHEAGLSPKQAKALLDKHLEWIRNQSDVNQHKQDEGIKKYRKEVQDEFIREVGGSEKFQAYVDTATRGFKAAASGAGLSDTDSKGILAIMGDDPRFIKIFNTIGAMYREDELVTGSRAKVKEESFEDMFSTMFNQQKGA